MKKLWKRPYWLRGGPASCTGCELTYVHEMEVRCTGCDRGFCAECVVTTRETRQVLCRDCREEADD